MDFKHLHIPTARVIHDGIPQAPFWGWPTATIDWCEESKQPKVPFEERADKTDYKITPYIAEFVNTITNAFFSMASRKPCNLTNTRIVSLACFGLRNSIKQ